MTPGEFIAALLVLVIVPAAIAFGARLGWLLAEYFWDATDFEGDDDG